MYGKLEFESIRLINIKDCVKMTGDLEYVREVYDIRYGYTTNNMTKAKNKDIGEAKS